MARLQGDVFPCEYAQRLRSKPKEICLSVWIPADLGPTSDLPLSTQMFCDPEKRGVWLGLRLLGGVDFRARQGYRLELDRKALLWLTGRAAPRDAIRLLRAVCNATGMGLSFNGSLAVVHMESLSATRQAHKHQRKARIKWQIDQRKQLARGRKALHGLKKLLNRRGAYPSQRRASGTRVTSRN